MQVSTYGERSCIKEEEPSEDKCFCGQDEKKKKLSINGGQGNGAGDGDSDELEPLVGFHKGGKETKSSCLSTCLVGHNLTEEKLILSSFSCPLLRGDGGSVYHPATASILQPATTGNMGRVKASGGGQETTVLPYID